jgi:hypothetical protein
MNASARRAAQMLVVLGFVLSATSGVISYLDNVTRRGYHFSGLRVIVIPLLNPLITIAAVFAWWWLTRLVANDDIQRTILRRAYLAFAVQYLLTSLLLLFIITPFQTFGGFWMTSVLWFDLVGASVSALGLLLYSRTLGQRRDNDELVAAVGATS